MGRSKITTKLKRKFAKVTGIPTTKTGRKKKVARIAKNLFVPKVSSPEISQHKPIKTNTNKSSKTISFGKIILFIMVIMFICLSCPIIVALLSQ